MPFYGEKPDGAMFYAQQGRMEIIAWAPPPRPGDGLCQALTGRTEDQLVRDILNGAYDHILARDSTAGRIGLDQQKKGAIR